MRLTYLTKLSKLIAITVLTFSSSSIADQAFEIGLGTNHAGVLGGTINIDVNPNTEFFWGLGLTAGEGVGYVIGSRYWINDNLRLIGNYGYNCTVTTISTTTTYKDYYGLNIGVFQFKVNITSLKTHSHHIFLRICMLYLFLQNYKIFNWKFRPINLMVTLAFVRI